MFVELTPVFLNSTRGGRVHDPALLHWADFPALPAGFREAAGYSLQELAELLTYERLFVKRRRLELQQVLLEDTGLGDALLSDGAREALDRRKKPPKPRELFTAEELPTHGHVRGVPKRRLTRKRFARERAKWKREAARGKFTHGYADFEFEAMRALVRKARESESKVVLHAPPSTVIYREIVEQGGHREPYCALVRELTGDGRLPYFPAFDAKGFGRLLFSDWLHLNPKGAEQYVDRLFAAVRTGEYPPDTWCGG